MTLTTLNQPRASVFDDDRRETVLNLDNFLAGKIAGDAFFRENFFTAGMSALVDRCFRQLAGRHAGASVFLLSQAMGGGKTHSMVALGLLGRDPALRQRVLGVNDPAPSLGEVQVIGFNGRNVEAKLGIWGGLAEQLGQRERFTEYYQPLSAPGPEAWKGLLDGRPVIVLLDELPPYMEHAGAVQIGHSDLGVVTAAALANLLVAASELPSVCVVISDLGGSNWQAGGALIQHALANLRNETRRSAVPITPVDPQGDELYQILRCRLFEKLAPPAEVERVAEAYRRSHAEAVKMGLTTTPSDGIRQQILDAYPFHPSWRELVGRFRENDGFQQTRGVIRLMQRVVAKLWGAGGAQALELLHPYDLDLDDPEIGSEIRAISPNLSEAIAHDVAHGGQAEIEQIDAQNRSADAGDAGRLLLLASLSTTPGAVHGLREFELFDLLQRPGRDLSAFKVSVLDLLITRAWYLHVSPAGRLYFKNQQNLAAKLRSTAQALHPETVLKKLRKHLHERFEPELRDAYQDLSVLPALDEVQLEQDKVMLVVAEPSGGHAGLPLSEAWQSWWKQQVFKNRVVFLTGSRMVMQSVSGCARQVRALESIEEELRAEGLPASDPQWRVLDGLRDRLLTQFRSALTQAFDTLLFPSIHEALRAQAVALEFSGNHWRGEAVVRRTLEGAQKLAVDVGADAFRLKAESRLFGAKSALWSEVRRKAATTTTWPLHAPRALTDLRAECLRKGLWREQGQYVEKGPFAKPTTSVAVRELSRDEDGTAWLHVEPLHGDCIHVEASSREPTAASPRVADPQRFEARKLRYRFLCVDSAGEHATGAAKEWISRIEVRASPEAPQAGQRLALHAAPEAAMRYSTDGSAPHEARIYEGPFVVPDGCRVILVVAEQDGIQSEVLRLVVHARDGDEARAARAALDPHAPCRWTKPHKLDDTAAVWAFVERLETHAATAHALTLHVDTDAGDQTLAFQGTVPAGYTGAQVRSLCDRAQALVGAPGVLRLKVQRVDFDAAQQLLDWLQAADQAATPSEVEQERRDG